MSAKESMLQRIKAGLNHSRRWLAAEAANQPHDPPAHVHPPQADLMAQFSTELTRLEGRVYRCADDETALETIRELLVARSTSQVVCWDEDQVGLPGLTMLLQQLGITVPRPLASADRGARHQQLEAAGVGITGVDLAIAESGTLLIRGGAARGRLASLLPPVHIAVVRQSQLVRGLGEALAQIAANYGPDPFTSSSSLICISGPSRTGDIELTLTLGVHGPREVHVVLVEEMLTPVREPMEAHHVLA